MEVRPHLSQHDSAKRLPLITESAIVTHVEPMDRSRNGAVIRAIRRTLDRHGSTEWDRTRPEGTEACRRWIRDHLDPIERGSPLNEYLPEGRRHGRVANKLSALQERYIRPYPSLARIRIETDEPIEFVAGQYLSMRFGGTARPYSVASSPTEDALEFCIRRVPGGRLTPEVFEQLESGAEVTLRGPYGDFVMEPPSGRDLVFLATGTGVAPFRSMIEYCLEMGRDRYEGDVRNVWLFLGCSWADDLPYRDRFETLASNHDHVHFVPTVTRERYLSEWKGETDYVQHVLVKYIEEYALDGIELPNAFEAYRERPPKTDIDARIDPRNVEVYACGINAMVHSLVRAVKNLGIHDKHTAFEGFG